MSAPTCRSPAGARAAPTQRGCAAGRRRQQRQRHQRLCCRSAADQQGADGRPRVVLYDCYDQQIPYEQAWQWQKDMVERVAARDGSGAAAGAAPPTLGALVLLQHPPVYTLGAGATEGHLRFDPAAPPLPLYRTERGGEVTYHGPGQLVMYPILDLRAPPLQPDLHWYLRSLEGVVMRALDAVSGLHSERVPGLTGVWVDGAKVAALGVRASRWVTYHGLALNVATDLAPFRQIVPCGIADRPVASVAGLLAAAAAANERRRPAAAAAAGGWEDDPLAAGFAAAAGGGGGGGTAAALADLLAEADAAAARAATQERQLLEEYRFALLEAFEEVFGVQLAAAPPDDVAAQQLAAREGAAGGGGAGAAG